MLQVIQNNNDVVQTLVTTDSLPPELPTNYQSFIHKSRYSRWIESEKRRETWGETVTRLLSFYRNFLSDKHNSLFYLHYTPTY